MAAPLSVAAASARLAARPAALFSSTAARAGILSFHPAGRAAASFSKPFSRPLSLASPVNPFSSSSSSQSRHRPSPLWVLAAAAPVVIVASDTDAESTAGLIVPPPPPGTLRQSRRGPPPLPLNQDVAREVSKGSFSGFALGILVSYFSRTLVLLLGLAITLQTLASRAGIDIAHHLKIKERVTSSKILSALNEHAAFKLSFGLTFAMAAFMEF